MVTLDELRHFFEANDRQMRGRLAANLRPMYGHHLEERIQNIQALAYEGLADAVAKGYILEPRQLWNFYNRMIRWAASQARRGRQIHRKTDNIGKDVMARGVRVEIQITDLCSDRDNPADVAAFHSDWTPFIGTLSDRDRDMIADMIVGLSNVEIAEKFGVGQPRVSQLRRRFVELWEEYTS